MAIDVKDAMLANTLTMLIIIFCIPIFGWASGKYRRKSVLALCASLFIVIPIPSILFTAVQKN